MYTHIGSRKSSLAIYIEYVQTHIGSSVIKGVQNSI